eukprot:4605404-Alexandrium_andersonii.AAC.1
MHVPSCIEGCWIHPRVAGGSTLEWLDRTHTTALRSVKPAYNSSRRLQAGSGSCKQFPAVSG